MQVSRSGARPSGTWPVGWATASRTPVFLDQALRHSSFAHENPGAGPSNEQMEFLGDAVLALTVSNLLLQHFPQSSEGELSRGRAALVNARRLAVLARELDLGAYLLLGRGEEQQAGREKPSLLADALEAVMAAVFLDGGLKAADRLDPALVLRRSWTGWPSRPGRTSKPGCRSSSRPGTRTRPPIALLSESGPSHARHFEVEVRLGERPLAQGQGRTKKQAEQLAARQALEILQGGEGE